MIIRIGIAHHCAKAVGACGGTNVRVLPRSDDPIGRKGKGFGRVEPPVAVRVPAHKRGVEVVRGVAGGPIVVFHGHT